METQSIDKTRMAEFLREGLGVKAERLEVKLWPLRGGLDSAGVWRLQARSSTRNGRCRSTDCVLKRVPVHRAREAMIHRHLVPKLCRDWPPHYWELTKPMNFVIFGLSRRSSAQPAAAPLW